MIPLIVTNLNVLKSLSLKCFMKETTLVHDSHVGYKMSDIRKSDTPDLQNRFHE